MPEATAESLAACEGRAGMTIHSDLAKRFLSGIEAMLTKSREKGLDAVRIPIADLAILIDQATPATEVIDEVSTNLMSGATGYGYTVEINFAKRFVDGLRDVLAAARERKPSAIKVPCSDVYLLIQLAKAGSIEGRGVMLGGVDLASGPDRTVVTKVEIVDGGAICDHEIEDLGAVARGGTP
jgi:hypothetical protein